jgi:hypothetical protein
LTCPENLVNIRASNLDKPEQIATKARRHKVKLWDSGIQGLKNLGIEGIEGILSLLIY